jgi:hypothetical protein
MTSTKVVSSPSSPDEAPRYFFDFEGSTDFKQLQLPLSDDLGKIKFDLQQAKKFECFSNQDDLGKKG